jgi:hypothetical protein
VSTHTVEIKLSDSDARLLRAEHDDVRSAVRAAVRQAVQRARLRAKYPRPHVPNAETARALRAKPSKRDKVFNTATGFSAYLDKFTKR